MNLTKQHKVILFGVATSIKREHPQYTNHTCLEEAMIKCVGFQNYNTPIPLSVEK